MSEAQKAFVIRSSDRVRDIMRLAYSAAVEAVSAGAVEVIIKRFEDGRTASQNSKLWPMLGDIAQQVVWPVNGRIGLISKEDWKDILSAELKHEQRIAQGISGGFVMLGLRTSKMKKREFADLIEVIYAFGSSHGVVWSEKANSAYQLYREAMAA